MEKIPHFPRGIGQKVTRNELRYYEPLRAITRCEEIAG